jgi:hypothetical protein
VGLAAAISGRMLLEGGAAAAALTGASVDPGLARSSCKWAGVFGALDDRLHATSITMYETRQSINAFYASYVIRWCGCHGQNSF